MGMSISSQVFVHEPFFPGVSTRLKSKGFTVTTVGPEGTELGLQNVNQSNSH